MIVRSNTRQNGRSGAARIVALLMASSALVGIAGAADAQTLAAAVPPAGPPAPQTVTPQTTTPQATDSQTGDAQAADPADIVVTGYRASIEQSLDAKRRATSIIDVITAEDISRFPDKNVADALQRLPGVVITRNGGEGQTVSVRGLPPGLALTLLNGNYVASSETNSEATRSFNYLLLPSNMLGQAELYKTSEAHIDEGGIGGTVILHTRRPLDLPAWSGFVTVEGTTADTTRRVDPQVSGQLSWHNEAGTFGVLAGATFQRRTNRSMEVSTEDWRWYADNGHPAVDVNGTALDPQPATWWGGSGFNDQNHPYTGTFQSNGFPTGRSYYSDFFMPTAVNFGIRNERRERLGIQGTVQWKPTPELTFTGNYFRFQLQGDYTLNSLKIPEWNLARYAGDGNWPGGRLLNGLTFDPSGTVVQSAAYQLLAGRTYYCNEAQAVAAGRRPGGWGPDDCTVPTPQLTGNYSRERALAQTAEFGAEYHRDQTDASFIAGRTWSSGGPSMNFRMSAKPRRFVNNAWQAGNRFSAWDLTGTPSMTFSDNLQQQILAGVAEIDVGSTDSSFLSTDVSQNYFQGDVTQRFGNGWLDSIQLGVKYRDGRVRRSTGNTYWVCAGLDPTNYENRYQNCDSSAGVAQPGFFLQNPITNIPGGFTTNVFPGVNYPAYIDYLTNRYGSALRHDEPDFIYRVRERILSAYVQANFNTGDLRGNIGLRAIRTRQHAESTDSVESFLDYFVDDPATGNPLACGANSNTCESGFVKNEVRTKTFQLNTLDRTYTDFLPSLNVAYNIRQDLTLRGAVSKVISRPAFTAVAFPGELRYYSPEYSSDRRFGGGSQNPGWYGNGSNKAIEPFSAWQYDIGLDWYFGRGSIVGIGLFRKDVRNFVVPVSQDTTVTIGGQTVVVQQFATSANGRNGKTQGIEVYAQHTFDFGLGFLANATFNDTGLAPVVLNGVQIGRSPLVGSAKNQFNFTAFYERHGFLARASFNRRGTVAGEQTNGLTIYQEPYNQVDLNVAYDIVPNVTVSASVLNLTKEEQRAHLGSDTSARLYTNNYSGRIFYTGVTFKF